LSEQSAIPLRHRQHDIRRKLITTDIVGQYFGGYVYGMPRSAPKSGIRFQAKITRVQPTARTQIVSITSQPVHRVLIASRQGFI
jgi:hypothetical protein